MTNRVSHRQHSQPEGEGNTEKADPKTREACRHDRAATASENQPKRPKEFGDHAPGHIAFHGCWLLRYPMSLYLKSTGAPQLFAQVMEQSIPEVARRRRNMVRIFLISILSLYAISANAADPSCTTQAAEKKLAGAAKTS